MAEIAPRRGKTEAGRGSRTVTQVEVGEAFLITGIPGAGKSTTARALAASFPRGVHIEGDVLRFDFVVSGLPDPFADEAGRREWDLQMELGRKHEGMLAGSFADAGFTPVIDDVITHPSVLDQVVRPLATRPVRLVVLAPPIDIVAQRDATREKHVFETWKHLDEQLRTRMRAFGFWIEDADLTVDEVVREILANRDRATLPQGDYPQ
jgi:predicted ATPase